MRVLKNQTITIRMADRRRRPERRGAHILFTDWRWAFSGRRAQSRRLDQWAEHGVDRYDVPLLVLAVGILILSCCDAAFTLILLQRGVATELNPLMRVLINHDPQIFVNLKVVVTGAAVVFMVALADWRFVRAVRVRHIMTAILITYGVLVALEVYHFLITA